MTLHISQKYAFLFKQFTGKPFLKLKSSPATYRILEIHHLIRWPSCDSSIPHLRWFLIIFQLKISGDKHKLDIKSEKHKRCNCREGTWGPQSTCSQNTMRVLGRAAPAFVATAVGKQPIWNSADKSKLQGRSPGPDSNERNESLLPVSQSALPHSVPRHNSMSRAWQIPWRELPTGTLSVQSVPLEMHTAS